MPRPKADEPRDHPLLIRLTARQVEVLQSVAHLARTTPNSYLHQLLVEHLATMVNNSHVKADLENRAAFDAEAATATPLRGRQRKKQRPPDLQDPSSRSTA